MEVDFTKLPIGTKVWSIVYGWGEIVSGNNSTFPVKVIFNCRCSATFSKDGRENSYHQYPTLFLNEFKIPESAFQPPRPNLKVDDKVLVWLEGGVKCKRHFSHWDSSGKICCFEDGYTSWSDDKHSTAFWDYYEIPESEE